MSYPPPWAPMVEPPMPCLEDDEAALVAFIEECLGMSIPEWQKNVVLASWRAMAFGYVVREPERPLWTPPPYWGSGA